MLLFPSIRSASIVALPLSLCCAISCSSKAPRDLAVDKTAAPSSRDVNGDHEQGASKLSETIKTRQPMVIEFNDTRYFFRFAEGGLFEFTPTGQEDLERWSDMLTITVYFDVEDSDGLALLANRTLCNYKHNMGTVIRSGSVPRTRTETAEHLIAVKFQRVDFSEFAQARFLLFKNLGMSFIHSHRVYGQSSADELDWWIEKNGVTLEQELMAWKAKQGR